MSNGLRNFVYLDESTLNDHLSSLGQGIPQAMTQQSGGETETTGEAKVGIPSIGLGAGGNRSRLNIDSAETTMRILAPYRFQQLEELIADTDDTIYTNSSDEIPPRAATVQITGEVSSMGLFDFETALQSIYQLIEGDVQQAMTGEDEAEDFSEEDMEELETLETLLSRFGGDEIPLQIFVGDNPYVIPLNREFMRVSPAAEFVENRQYTVLGRVESIIAEDETWDPAVISRVLDRYLPQERTGDELRQEMKNMADEMGIQIDDEDLLARGPGCVIHPIGMYW
jgi:hypothetical protein